MTLDEEDVEAIARRVAELVAPQAPDSKRYLTAGEVAEQLGVDRTWVYDHQADLGAIRLGTSARPRLRFDSARVREALERREQPPAPTPARPRRRRPARVAEDGPFGATVAPRD
jgi:predicted DNA-binding transcriptional regulator AlpA